MKWVKARYYRDIEHGFKTYIFKVWDNNIFKLVLLHTKDEKLLGRKKIINPDYISFVNFTNKTVVRDYLNEERREYPLKIKKEDLVWLLKISYTTGKCECSSEETMDYLIKKLINYD